MATPTKTSDSEIKAPAPSPNAMSEEQFAELLAQIERRKQNPGYFERWEEQVTEYRKQVKEQFCTTG